MHRKNPSLKRTLVTGEGKLVPIWSSNEWKKIIGENQSKEVILKIFNKSETAASFGQREARKSKFNCLAFSPDVAILQGEDVKRPDEILLGCLLAIGDQRGHLFLFNFCQNQMKVIAKTGIAITAICFSFTRRKEIMVALSDCSLQCYHTETGQLITRLTSAHKDSCRFIDSHRTKPLALSCASTEAILWDTETWEKKRMLTGTKAVLQHAMFASDGSSLIASFDDGTILFWTLHTFSLSWKITIASPEVFPISFGQNISSWFDISKNGEWLAYCGSQASIMVWNIFEKRLVHEITVPLFHKPPRRIQFLGHSNIVSVLTDNGKVIFVDVENAKFHGQIQGKGSFEHFAISPQGLLLAGLLSDTSHIAVIMNISDVVNVKTIKDGDDIKEIRAREVLGLEESVSQTRPIQLDINNTAFYQLVENKAEKYQINVQKLQRFLSFYGEFPGDFRTVIWRFLLKLPENRSAYEILLDQGTHPAHVSFRKKYPIKDHGLARAMERMLSSLAYWSPIFEILDYVPGMIFPFVKVFRKDIFSGFEAILSVLLNWCQSWWEYYPNPPIEYLEMIEDLLAYHDKELYSHFFQSQITSQAYAWPLMKSFFSDTISEAHWLKLWDHIIANPPSFFLYVILSYVTIFRLRLLATSNAQQVQQFFERLNPVDVNDVIMRAYRLQRSTPKAKSSEQYLKGYEPLGKGDYPIFKSYPRFIVNYQNRLRDKIREEEEEFVQKRKQTEEIEQLADELRKDRAAWNLADWKMTKMIEDWWEKMIADEEIRMKKKVQRDIENRFNRLQNLNRIAQARKSFIHQNIQATENHLTHMSKVANHQFLQSSIAEENATADVSLKHVEDEWLDRREEMLKTRDELNALRTQL